MPRMLALGAAAAALALALAGAATGNSASASFTNTPLISTFDATAFGITTAPNANSTGNSEPAIAFGGPNDLMAVDGLAWLPFQVNLWTGAPGSIPGYFGAMDTSIPSSPGRVGLGDGDADLDIGSTGTIHLADLDFFFNKTFKSFTLGVSVTNCPASATGPSGCKTQILDTAGADRPWITSNGSNVWVSYHDSGNSSLIHVQRSTDDGATWSSVGSPIPGEGAATGNSTFNNTQGPIVADPTTGDLFDVFAAGQAGIQKGTSGNFNNIYVSRSTDGGRTWTAKPVFSAPLFTRLNNVFPSLAVDPVSGALYATWSDGHTVSVARSVDHGQSWSSAVAVSHAPANTAIFPWIAAHGGTVDVVYYGTDSSENADGAVWHTYLSQSTDGLHYTQSAVNSTPNHVGVICTNGTGCASGTRNLLDLFEVAIDPATGLASIIYTNDLIDTWTQNGTTQPLPEIVLAQQQ